MFSASRRRDRESAVQLDFLGLSEGFHYMWYGDAVKRVGYFSWGLVLGLDQQ